MKEHEVKQVLQVLLHASHDPSRVDEATARFLHDVLAVVLGVDQSPWPRDFHGFVELLWAYRRLRRHPLVTWGIGDALAVAPEPRTQTVFVLPTNTKLSTSAKVVQHARKGFGDQPFEELAAYGKAELGSVIETSAGTYGQEARICHLVCREPGKPEIQTLRLPKWTWAPGRFVIPLFGTSDELDLWANALVEFRDTKEIQTTRPFFTTFRVLEQDRKIGFGLERQLIRRGTLVGRVEGCGIDYPDDDLVSGYTYATSLARFVSPDGPLTPAIYADWVNSGIDLPSKAWKFHERVMRGEA